MKGSSTWSDAMELIKKGYGDHAALERAWEKVVKGSSFKYIVLKDTRTLSTGTDNAFNFDFYGANTLNELKVLFGGSDKVKIFDSHEKKYLVRSDLAVMYVDSLTPEQLHELTKKALAAYLTRK